MATNKEYAMECIRYGLFNNFDDALAYVKAMRAYKRTCKKLGINITEHNGKLTGFYSLSTSSLINPLCIARSKNPDLICFWCYANTLQNIRTNLQKALIRNTEILTKQIIDLPPLPKECRYFRIESFGDLNNVIQAENYRKFILENEHVFFGWWSKNDFIIRQIDGFERPKNCNLISSSEKLNTKRELPEHFNKTFTVFEHDNGCINCGSKCCGKCLTCYKDNTTDTVYELKK